MSLNSLYLDAFYACAQLGHFTQASKKLHITQSALSQRIKNLELELGTTLIVRGRAGLRLTEQGQNLLRYCQSRELIEKEVTAQITGDSTPGLHGDLRIGGFSSVMGSALLPALAPLLKANAGIRLQLLTKELYELRPLLQSGQIDFMITDQIWVHEGVIAAKIGVEKNVLVQKRNYMGPDVYLDHDESDLVTSKYLKKSSMKKTKRHYLDDVTGLLCGVKLGLGRAVLPLHIVAQMQDLEVIESHKVLGIPVYIHYYESPYYSALQTAVLEVLQNEFAKCLE